MESAQVGSVNWEIVVLQFLVIYFCYPEHVINLHYLIVVHTQYD